MPITFRRHRPRSLKLVFTGLLVSSFGMLAAPLAQADLSDPGGANRLPGDQTTVGQQAFRPEGARNVILLIGDGMGDSEITIARNYAYGAAGILPGIDALPVTGQYTTYSQVGRAPDHLGSGRS